MTRGPEPLTSSVGDADWAITVNVGSGPGGSAIRSRGMAEWAQSALERRPAFVFAQEVTDPWLSVWKQSEYTVILGAPPTWAIRSALLARKDLSVRSLTADDHDNLGYHGSYVAAGVWTNSPLGDVVLASVHASPNPAEPDRYGWTGPVPQARTGGGDSRWPGNRLWDSDMVLHTLDALAQRSPLIAAGDLNESRLDDRDEFSDDRGTWGREFFARATSIGLVDPVHRALGQELLTRDRLQLDHVLASRAGLQLLPERPLPHLDPSWTADALESLSDHTALWFPISVH